MNYIAMFVLNEFFISVFRIRIIWPDPDPHQDPGNKKKL